MMIRVDLVVSMMVEGCFCCPVGQAPALRTFLVGVRGGVLGMSKVARKLDGDLAFRYSTLIRGRGYTTGEDN